MFRWYRRNRTFRLDQQRLCRHTIPVLCEQRVRIDFDTDWIGSERVALHVRVSLLGVCAAVNLKFHSIAVGIAIVDG